jgi:hypothetical protein
LKLAGLAIITPPRVVYKHVTIQPGPSSRCLSVF